VINRRDNRDQWAAWNAYFAAHGLKWFASVLGGVADTFTVPAAFPWDFDTTYDPSNPPKPWQPEDETKTKGLPPAIWSEEAAFKHIERTLLARRAAREGWIGPLIGFVRRNCRTPTDQEIPAVIEAQREFEASLEKTQGSGPARQWRRIGEAMAQKQLAWAQRILHPMLEAAE
jgi:hypothetical protein